LEQSNLLGRFNLFIQEQKARVVAEKQAAVKLAKTKQQNEIALNDLAKTAILFDHLVEHLSLGVKKTFVYDIKCVKDYALRKFKKAGVESNGANHVGGAKSTFRLSPEDIIEIRSKDFFLGSKVQASDKTIERFQRDIAAMIDSHALDRRTTVQQLVKSGSSAHHVAENLSEMYEYQLEVTSTELEKFVITLAGIWLNNSDLLSNETAVDDDEGLKNIPRSTSPVDLLFGEEDLDLIGDGSYLKEKRSESFGVAISTWFSKVLMLLKLFSSIPVALRLALDAKCTDVLALRSNLSPVAELSSEFRYQLQKQIFFLISTSFVGLVRAPEGLVR
jgi:hypothetical protein